MKQFSSLLQTLRDTSGSNAKKAVLADFGGHEEKLNYALNEFMKFNITSKSISPEYGELNLDWPRAKELLDSLHSREVTGNTAIKAVVDLLYKVEQSQGETFLCFIDKDLRAGTGISLVNKVFKDLIPTFDVQLCKKYEDLETLPYKQTYCSRKLDGIRVLAIKKGGNWGFFSRKGNEFLALNVLRNNLEMYFEDRDNIVFDGEVSLITEDGGDDFSGIVSEIKRKNHTIENPMYHIFDFLSLEDFQAKYSKKTFDSRYNYMMENLHFDGASNFRILPQFPLESAEQLIEESAKASTLNWEGLILKDGEAPYEGKRVKSMLKVKKFYDHEFEVTGSYEGEGEFVGILGGLNLKGTIENLQAKWEGLEVISDVGSGFKVDQRSELWANPEELVGQIITVKFFELCKKKDWKPGDPYSLRFPTFKYFHGKERMM